jgi:hypothetical protein
VRTEGSNVTLECTARGSPNPTVIWKREDGLNINIDKARNMTGESTCGQRKPFVVVGDRIIRRGVADMLIPLVSVDVDAIISSECFRLPLYTHYGSARVGSS